MFNRSCNGLEMLGSKLFNSILITSLTAGTMAFSLSLQAEEKENTDKDKTLVITANRTEQNINDVLAAVEVITREDIERIQPSSVADLFDTVAGLDVARNGGAGQQASLFTRGTNSDHTLVLIDGVRVGSATTGNKALSSIPVSQIERIEIVKGPRASLWGSDAIGGVIQIFTRRLTSNEWAAQIRAGSNSTVAGDISFGFGSDKIANTVTLSYEDSAGFDAFDDSSEFGPDSQPDDDGFDRLSAAIRGDYELSDATNLQWVAQIDQGNSQYDNNFGADQSDYDNYFWNIKYTYVADSWQSEFAVKQSQDSTQAVGVGPQSVFETTRNQINALTQYQLNQDITFIGGIEHFVDDVSASAIVQFDGSVANFADEERATDSVFLSSQLQFGELLSEFSVRHDDIENVDKVTTFNASLGYHISDSIMLAASRSKGFKAPTFNDLYYPGFSNPNLTSEVSYNSEVLLRWTGDNQQFVINFFDNQVDDLIAFKFDPAVGFAPFNVDKADLSGHEVVYQLKNGKINHKVSASFVDAKDLSIDAFTGLPKGTQLIRRAKEHYGYEITADLGALSLFSQINYTGPRPDTDFSTGLPATLDSFFSVDLGATYTFDKHWNLKVKVSDFTDAAAQSVVDYNAPGQQVFVTLQYLNF